MFSTIKAIAANLRALWGLPARVASLPDVLEALDIRMDKLAQELIALDDRIDELDDALDRRIEDLDDDIKDRDYVDTEDVERIARDTAEDTVQDLRDDLDALSDIRDDLDALSLLTVDVRARFDALFDSTQYPDADALRKAFRFTPHDDKEVG